MLETSQAYGHIRDIGLGRVDQQGLRLHRLTQAILRDHTADHQAAYRNIAIEDLVAAAPQNSDDPASWPDWSPLVPHLLAVAPENAPAPSATRLRRGPVSNPQRQTQAGLAMTTRLHQIWTAELGPTSDTLTAAQHLAHATHDTGNYAEALKIPQDTLVRRRRLLGEDHLDTLDSANDLSASLRVEDKARRRWPWGRTPTTGGDGTWARTTPTP